MRPCRQRTLGAMSLGLRAGLAAPVEPHRPPPSRPRRASTRRGTDQVADLLQERSLNDALAFWSHPLSHRPTTTRLGQ